MSMLVFDRVFSAIDLASRGVVTLDDIGFISQSSAKKTIIEQARQWPTYFCRFFPVSVSDKTPCGSTRGKTRCFVLDAEISFG